MSNKSVKRGSTTRAQECPTRMFYSSVSCKSVYHKSILQKCPARAPRKSVAKHPTRVSHKSVLQGCATRASHTRVSYKSDPRECRARVPHKNVKHYLDIVFQCVSALGFMGCILSFKKKLQKTIIFNLPRASVVTCGSRSGIPEVCARDLLAQKSLVL